METDKLKVGFEFSLFGFLKVKLDGDFSDRERDTAARVLRRLADHAALYRETELEYAGRVVTSVERMRQWLGEELRVLPAKTSVSVPLLALQSACRDFLAAIDHLDDQISTSELARPLRNERTNLCSISPPFAQFRFVAELERLRVKACPVIAALAGVAGNQAVPDDLRSLQLEGSTDLGQASVVGGDAAKASVGDESAHVAGRSAGRPNFWTSFLRRRSQS